MATEVGDIRGGRLGLAEYEANFADLVPPLDRPRAVVAADRCLFCHDAPCIEACPTSIDIPRFIRGIQTGNVKGAATTILEANIMGGTCARVCPTEVLCEGACVRMVGEGKPVLIGRLQRYATDWLFERQIQPFIRAEATGQRVAVIGAGPAGLSCAHALARQGHDVVVFERRAKPGGLNEHGIAAYKMAHGFAQAEVDFITAIGGIEVRNGMALGRDVHLKQLRHEFAAVFIATGLQGTNALGLEGEGLDGVMNAIDYIERLRQADDKASLPVGRDIVVIGGGNTAIDISIQTKRLGAENVTLVYRRGPEAMSATHHEQELAQLNGVKIKHWARPVGILGEGGKLTGVRFEYTKLDAGKLVGTGEGFTLEADQLFKAIGQHLVPAAMNETAGLLEIAGGKITVDKEGRTSLDRVWTGGDAIDSGVDLTVQAVEDGKIAAASIHRYLMGA